jgi:hypothetical protein
MDRLRRTLSFRNRKKEKITNNNNNNTKTVNKPLQWHEDEKSVRTSTCNYNVKVKEKQIYVNFVREKQCHFSILEVLKYKNLEECMYVNKQFKLY